MNITLKTVSKAVAVTAAALLISAATAGKPDLACYAISTVCIVANLYITAANYTASKRTLTTLIAYERRLNAKLRDEVNG